MNHSRPATSLSLIALVLAGCGNAPPADHIEETSSAETASANVVEVTALDYVLHAPAEVPSGWTTFRLRNEGSEPHYFTLYGLKGDFTLPKWMHIMRNPEQYSDWTEEDWLAVSTLPLGGPNAPVHGATSTVTMDLEPGRYALICWWPSPDHTPHAMKGMVWPITVTEDVSPGEEPVVNAELVMRDYAFELSGPVRPGVSTIRVTTDPAAVEMHEAFLARLEPGQTAEELQAWFHEWLMEGKRGEPPAELVSGVAMMAPGESVYLTADFAPGEYVFICPLPSGDGEMHSEKGMIEQFTVQAV